MLRECLVCALWLGACSPGPTYELGRLADAGDDEPDGEVDGSAFGPCKRNDDCTSAARRYCDQERERCVECLNERHCEADEWCSQRGSCIEER